MTTHRIFYENAAKMDHIKDEIIDLVVTSPPYPMIEMWDKIFFQQNNKIRTEFDKKNFYDSFELMHMELDKIWEECFRVLKPGGIACINIGDATRTLNKNFQLFSNHARIIHKFINKGFQNLPNIIWRKQTNAPNKFMGSGMLPPGAYVTLEHEFILIFRKGGKRGFSNPDDKVNRHFSSYFWEERNIWFSDLWDIKGTNQKLLDKKTRERSAAYPFDIPYRLINMFTTQSDIVLDPFLGTGTTSMAAIASNRNSIGYEIDTNLKDVVENSLIGSEKFINTVINNRFTNHLKYVEERKKKKGINTFKYNCSQYGFPVMTKQEVKIRIPYVKKIIKNNSKIEADYYHDFSLIPPSSNISLF